MTGRAVIYARISKDREGSAVGVDRQEADCRALAGKLGLAVDRVFVDNDVSASTLSTRKRPAYEEMMTLAETGQIGVIVAYSNSRLTRRPRELERLIEAHARTGVEFRTVVSGMDDLSTADGRMTARIKANVDTAESERIGERTRRAKQQARDEGRWPGGWRCYGFEADGRTVRPGEAAVIAEACREILDGRSATSLTAGLNDRGVATSTGKAWTRRSLLRVLSRRHPSIDEGVTDAVRWLLADPSRRTSPGNTRRWLLSGLARCGVCGDTLRGSGSSRGRGQGNYPAYRCRTGKHVVANAIVLDEYVTAIALERLSRPDVADLLAPAAVDTSSLRLEAVALRVRLDALADDLEMDERTLQRRARALRSRIDELEQRIASSLASSPLAAFGSRNPAEAWAELDLQRRAGVVALLMTVTIARTGAGLVPMEHRWRPDLPSFDPRRVEITPRLP